MLIDTSISLFLLSVTAETQYKVVMYPTLYLQTSKICLMPHYHLKTEIQRYFLFQIILQRACPSNLLNIFVIAVNFPSRTIQNKTINNHKAGGSKTLLQKVSISCKLQSLNYCQIASQWSVVSDHPFQGFYRKKYNCLIELSFI